MRLTLALAAALIIATPALAQTAPASTVERGQTLRDANAARIGVIDRVNADGSVQIIFDSRFVRIPADKLVAAENGVNTTLTKREIRRLR